MSDGDENNEEPISALLSRITPREWTLLFASGGLGWTLWGLAFWQLLKLEDRGWFEWLQKYKDEEWLVSSAGIVAFGLGLGLWRMLFYLFSACWRPSENRRPLDE